MSRLVLALGILSVWLIVGCAGAFADTVPVTTVAVEPLYAIAEPYILTAFGVVFSALLTWGVSEFRRRTGVQISADAQAKFQIAATNAAGRILAGVEGNLANVKVDVRSPEVAREATTVEGLIPGAIATLGIHPADVGDVLAHAIAGKVGVLQSSATVPTLKIGA